MHRYRIAMLTVIVLATIGIVRGAATPAVAQTTQPIRTSYHQLSVNCTSTGQLCNKAAFTGDTVTFGLFRVQFTASSSACSSIRVRFVLNWDSLAVPKPAKTEVISPFVAAGQSTPVYDFGPLTPGVYSVSVYAEGQYGGCNTGLLSGWGGKVKREVSGAERTYAASVTCNWDHAQYRCDPPYTVSVPTTGGAFVNFRAHPDHCGNIRVHIYAPTGTRGLEYYTKSGWLPAGTWTGTVYLPVPAGTHTIKVEAEGQYGGCITDGLMGWGGTLVVHTSH